MEWDKNNCLNFFEYGLNLGGEYLTAFGLETKRSSHITDKWCIFDFKIFMIKRGDFLQMLRSLPEKIGSFANACLQFEG